MDSKQILSKLNDEINYALNEQIKTVCDAHRPYAHSWAKGYHKGLAFARELLQQYQEEIDLRDAPAEALAELHYLSQQDQTKKE